MGYSEKRDTSRLYDLRQPTAGEIRQYKFIATVDEHPNPPKNVSKCVNHVWLTSEGVRDTLHLDMSIPEEKRVMLSEYVQSNNGEMLSGELALFSIQKTPEDLLDELERAYFREYGWDGLEHHEWMMISESVLEHHTRMISNLLRK